MRFFLLDFWYIPPNIGHTANLPSGSVSVHHLNGVPWDNQSVLHPQTSGPGETRDSAHTHAAPVLVDIIKLPAPDR